jgi:hypothetical protein
MKPMYAIHWHGVEVVEVAGVYTSLPLAALHALKHMHDHRTFNYQLDVLRYPVDRPVVLGDWTGDRGRVSRRGIACATSVEPGGMRLCLRNSDDPSTGTGFTGEAPATNYWWNRVNADRQQWMSAVWADIDFDGGILPPFLFFQGMTADAPAWAVADRWDDGGEQDVAALIRELFCRGSGQAPSLGGTSSLG